MCKCPFASRLLELFVAFLNCLFFILFIYLEYMYVGMYVCACGWKCTRVDVRGYPVRISSLLLLIALRVLYASPQVWWQVPLPTESSHCPKLPLTKIPLFLFLFLLSYFNPFFEFEMITRIVLTRTEMLCQKSVPKYFENHYLNACFIYK